MHFDDVTTVTGIANSAGTALTFVVPDREKGPHLRTFTDGFGNKASRIMDFVIVSRNTAPPEIYSISPAIGPTETEVTIYGTGFTAANNQVELGQNSIKGVSSLDGRSIKVRITSDFDVSTEHQRSGVSGEWPVSIYVANANGRAATPTVFVVRN